MILLTGKPGGRASGAQSCFPIAELTENGAGLPDH
jgi:hypothetical protein